MALIDSHSESNNTGVFYLGQNTNGTKLGQSFTNSYDSKLTSAKFYLRKYNSPTGDMTVKIYNHSGTYGTTSVPSGAAIATSDVKDASTIPSSALTLVEFSFSGANQITLSSGTYYVVSVEFSGGDSSNFIYVGTSSGGSATHSGNYCYAFTSWSPNGNYDLNFYVYGTRLYTITASTMTGGTVEPDGETLVLDAGSQAYTITANENYVTTDVLIDSSSVGKTSNYTFSNVTADHTISATFYKPPTVTGISTIQGVQTITL
jgi:hypothetical protein